MKWTRSSGKGPPQSPAQIRAATDAAAHGARLPPGQLLTTKWPVLQYAGIPPVDPARWAFRVFGAVMAPLTWSWEEFQSFPHGEVVSDMHCVTHWSRFDNRWEGIPAAEVVARARPRPEATHVLVHGFDGYTTNLPLASLLHQDAIFAFHHDGVPLTPEHGGPCRLMTSADHYIWKAAKWVSGLQFLSTDQAGFWEQNGYHMNANPFRNERYG